MIETAKVIHTDQRFINGLLQNDTLTVQEIYERFSGKVKCYIIENNGTEDNSADIFQDALIDIYHHAKTRSLQLSCPFKPFLLLVCRRKWLNELKKRGRHKVTNDTEGLSTIGEDVFAMATQLQEQGERTKLFWDM